MKKLFTLLLLSLFFWSDAQYFQRIYNLNTTPGSKYRDEVFNSGIHTVVNFDSQPDSTFLASIGTSYRNRALGITHTADRLRYAKTNKDGSIVPHNFGFEFLNPNGLAYHSSGNSIAEIRLATGKGGFIGVGAASDNSFSGASLPGGSDALFVRLNASGNIVNAFTLDFINSADTAWCVRRSKFQNNTFILCGQSTDKTSGNTRCFVAKINAAGGIIWAFTYTFDNTVANGISAECRARMLCEDGATGNIYVVGTHRDRSTSASDVNGLIFSLSSTGGVLWSNIYQLAPDDEFKAVKLTSDRNLVVGGHTDHRPAGTAAPMLNPLILKVRATTGAIIWQRLLRATDASGQQFDSKCYDVLERKYVNTTGAIGFNYYLVGPVYDPIAGVSQIMYKTNNTGFGLENYVYNRMKFDSLFGIDIDTSVLSTTHGLFIFSSREAPTGFSSSHIMKTTLKGETCFEQCGYNPPKNIGIQMIIQTINPFITQNVVKTQVPFKRYAYQSHLDCSQTVITCARPRQAGKEIALTPDFKHSQLTAFPNPVNGNLNIRMKNNDKASSIILFNMYGQKVWQSKIIGQANIDMRHLPRGSYYLQANECKESETIKIVKQ